jgi:uncharacterized protein YndB with AHSA1/START domain
MSQTSSGESIVSEITIESSPERIFDALTNPQERVAWWGGGGANARFKTDAMDSDLRVGGKWEMRGMTGERPFSISGEYREVDRPRALAFTWSPSWAPDAAGSLVRFELIDQNGATLVRITHSGLTAEAAKAHAGWANILGWLKAHAESSAP